MQVQSQLTPAHRYFINGVANQPQNDLFGCTVFVLLDTNYNDFLIFDNSWYHLKEGKP